MSPLLKTLAFGLAMTAGAVSAEAMPISSMVSTSSISATPALDDGPTPAIELVAGGCGIGFHRGPYGGCRPNGFYGRPFYHRYGWHRGWHRW